MSAKHVKWNAGIPAGVSAKHESAYIVESFAFDAAEGSALQVRMPAFQYVDDLYGFTIYDSTFTINDSKPAATKPAGASG